MRKVSISGLSDFLSILKDITSTSHSAQCLFQYSSELQWSHSVVNIYFSLESVDISCKSSYCLHLDCSLLVPPLKKIPGVFALWMRVDKTKENL